MSHQKPSTSRNRKFPSKYKNKVSNLSNLYRALKERHFHGVKKQAYQNQGVYYQPRPKDFEPYDDQQYAKLVMACIDNRQGRNEDDYR